MIFTPADGLIFAHRVETEELSAGGILLPLRDKTTRNQYEVVAVGRLPRCPHGDDWEDCPRPQRHHVRTQGVVRHRLFGIAWPGDWIVAANRAYTVLHSDHPTLYAIRMDDILGMFVALPQDE